MSSHRLVLYDVLHHDGVLYTDKQKDRQTHGQIDKWIIAMMKCKVPFSSPYLLSLVLFSDNSSHHWLWTRASATSAKLSKKTFFFLLFFFSFSS